MATGMNKKDTNVSTTTFEVKRLLKEMPLVQPKDK